MPAVYASDGPLPVYIICSRSQLRRIGSFISAAARRLISERLAVASRFRVLKALARTLVAQTRQDKPPSCLDRAAFHMVSGSGPELG
jgi:hypothetical protein